MVTFQSQNGFVSKNVWETLALSDCGCALFWLVVLSFKGPLLFITCTLVLWCGSHFIVAQCIVVSLRYWMV